MEKNSKQIVSAERVAQHGEVFTSPREVNAMLDLVEQETLNIHSRFLEPACGKGAFLTEIIKRKLNVVKARYAKSPTEYKRYAFIAISSIYGIDILEDNVHDCRSAILEILQKEYEDTLHTTYPKQSEYAQSIDFVLQKNIIWGDALTLKQIAHPDEYITFSEWSFPFNNSKVKRKDFVFKNLLNNEDTNSLFSSKLKTPRKNDLGQTVYIPYPIKDFPVINYLKIRNVEKDITDVV